MESFFHACKKDRTNVVYESKPAIQSSNYATLASFYKTMRPQTQTFEIDGSAGGLIRGNRGMEFRIAPNTFVNNQGIPVTGKVKITLIEVTNYAEMMGTGARTEAIDGILGSAAMFNINATNNGVIVYPSMPIKAAIPINKDININNVNNFTGVVTLNNNNDTTIKWVKDSIKVVYNADSINRVYDSLLKVYNEKRIVKFDLYVCGWCNLDAYYNDPSGFPIKCTFSGISDVVSSEAYIKLNEQYLKGFYRLEYDDVKKQFSSTYYNLPSGWKINIIVLLKDKNKKVYMQDMVISNDGKVYDFTQFAEISDANLESYFKSL
ncbi:MAG: hypothetical protein H7321_01505 [Bacteroidia bacterium]|nr:hypothetical protein [Bacteroidia bacterium]